jgi:HSP20 family protein
MLLRFDPVNDLNRPAGHLHGTAQAPQPVPMDCYRYGDELHLHFDLPGIDVDSLEVTQESNTLTVRARRSAGPPPDARYLVNERPVGSYLRQLIVGDGLGLDAIVAEYTDGVLTLTIPVAELARPRRITVGHGRDHGPALAVDQPSVGEGSTEVGRMIAART